MESKTKVISIVGPTASGKSRLAVEVAKKLNGEVISVDSMQIYKGMDIATAKITEDEAEGVVHHLIDFLDVTESFSVAQFVHMAKDVIADIVSRGKIPILAGGTGLYMDSLLKGIEFSEGPLDANLRKELFKKLDDEGIDSLLDMLKEFDLSSYKKLKEFKNPKRVIRAIEVYKTTGVTATEQNERSMKNGSAYNPTKIGISYKNRENLYSRINSRVDKMIADGLVSEASKFYAEKAGDTSVQAIGYKELKPFIENEETLEVCVEKLKQSTRRYAKRQLTWFNRDSNIIWFYCDNYKTFDELAQNVFLLLKAEGFDMA